MNRYRALALVAVLTVASACGDDDDAGGPTGTSSSPPDTSTVASTATPNTQATTTTAEPTTSAETTTTVPEIATLTEEQVAELPGRALRAPFSDGSSIVALSSVAGEHFLTPDALVRLDQAGTIVQEGPPGSLLESDVDHIIAAGERHFVLARFSDPPGFNTECGLREVDVAILAFGPLLPFGHGGACSGPFAVDDVDPSIVWIEDNRRILRFDVATGALVPFELGPIDLERYAMVDLVAVGGNAYVGLQPYHDAATGGPVTAPDGSALPSLIVRVDGSTGATTSGPVGSGVLRAAGAQIFVGVKGAWAQRVDPVTLAVAEIDHAQATRLIDIDQGWFVSYDGDPVQLTASQVDPATGAVIGEGQADTTAPESGTVFSAVVAGKDLYVLATVNSGSVAAGDRAVLTKVFRVSGRS